MTHDRRTTLVRAPVERKVRPRTEWKMTEHQRQQYRHEIIWVEREIEKLALRLKKNPSVQKQIDEYRYQIEHKKYQIELGV